jgi:hypothetical protein
VSVRRNEHGVRIVEGEAGTAFLDRRLPESLGNLIRNRPKGTVASEWADYIEADHDGIGASIAIYEDGPFMSADPGEHHSKTPQTVDHTEENPDA